VYNQQENEVRSHIKRGVNVNYFTEDSRWTCLHVAARSGALNIAEMLLAAGATPSPQENEGWTPLHLAVYHGHIKIVEALLASGAQLDLKTTDGATPLDIAMQTKQQSIADLISSHGGQGNSLERNLYNAASGGDLENVRRLIKMGARVDFRSPDNLTPLHIAAFSGHTEIVRLLLASGANKEGANEESTDLARTPLILAVEQGHAEVVSTLIDASANVNYVAPGGFAALNFAAEGGFVDIVRLLLENNADPNNEDVSDPPLFYAVQNGHLHMVRLLVEHGARINPYGGDWVFRTALHLAAKAGNLEMTKLLISLGAQPNVWNFEQKTPLDFAMNSGNEELVQFLKTVGAKKGEEINLIKEIKP
jgi:ankyrin repeat protein